MQHTASIIFLIPNTPTRTWRKEMYALSGTMDLRELEDAARACYVEMLEAGFTAVGEFHYVHHQVSEGWTRAATRTHTSRTRASEPESTA